MGTYTTTLKEIVDLYALDGTSGNIADKIELARPKLFDFDYPVFDSNYKKDFETHFIRNFYMREIGFETEGLFKFNLENYLLINMPYWNKLFESELISFDPMSNTKTDTNHNATKDSTANSNSETKGNSSGTSTQNNNGTLTEKDFARELESNTPDTRLQITANDGTGVIEYASNIKEDSANNSKTSSSTGSDTTSQNSDVTSTASVANHDEEKQAVHVEGKIGSQSYSKMLQEYRETFLRIEKEIFNEMNQLFMLVY